MRATNAVAGRPERPAVWEAPAGAHDPVEVLTAINVVAAALTAAGSLEHLASTALRRMRESLGLEIVAIHLAEVDDEPPSGKRPEALIQFATDAVEGTSVRVRRGLSLGVPAWSLLTAARGPVVVGEAASWLIPNPFDPPPASWLALPLQSAGRIVGTVVGASERPITLDAAGVVLLSALGKLLSAGIAQANVRTEIQRLAVQQERRRLAAELHDGLAQDLAVAKRELALLQGAPSAAAGEASWSRLREAIEGAHRVVRAGLEDLSVVVPIGGLFPTVEELCRRFEERRGVAVSVNLLDRGGQVAPEVASTVLRVLQEALANVHQHSGARRAQVRLSVSDDALLLEVRDPGRGIHGHRLGPPEGHMGIAIMRERGRFVGGAVEIAAPPEGGTIVRLHVPLVRPGSVA